MCIRPNHEEDEQELEGTLLSAFRQWKLFMSALLDEEEMKSMNLIEEFCQDTRRQLQDLQDKDML